MTKNELETAFVHIRNWVDTMYVKYHSDKTDYILFRSTKQLEKISTEPLNASGYLTPLSCIVKYLGG